MKSKKKQEELDKQRILVLQILEYLIEHYTGSFVLDDYDLSREYYLQEKNQVEKYYNERRLDKIKAKLAKFIHSLCRYKNIEYTHYIEETTGYRINLYNEIQGRTNKILQNGIIANTEELADIEYMILLCENDPNSSFDKNLYQNLLNRYHKFDESNFIDSYIKKKVPDINYTKSENQSDKELKIEKGLIYKINSPNSKNWIALYTSGKNEFALTYLVVGVDGGNASVYSAKGENLIINAYWENDSTIVIETSNKYKTSNCYKKITTKSSNISIKYIDKA